MRRPWRNIWQRKGGTQLRVRGFMCGLPAERRVFSCFTLRNPTTHGVLWHGGRLGSVRRHFLSRGQHRDLDWRLQQSLSTLGPWSSKICVVLAPSGRAACLDGSQRWKRCQRGCCARAGKGLGHGIKLLRMRKRRAPRRRCESGHGCSLGSYQVGNVVSVSC